MKPEKSECMVTVRLTKAEREKLNQKAHRNGTTVSKILKEAIRDQSIMNNRNDTKIATLICRLYVSLAEKGFDKDEKIMGELNDLCRTLSQ